MAVGTKKTGEDRSILADLGFYELMGDACGEGAGKIKLLRGLTPEWLLGHRVQWSQRLGSG